MPKLWIPIPREQIDNLLENLESLMESLKNAKQYLDSLEPEEAAENQPE